MKKTIRRNRLLSSAIESLERRVLLAVTPAVVEWPVADGGNGHFYALTSAALNFDDAEAQAVKYGGHLATINDDFEQQFIEQTFLSPPDRSRVMWIGMTDADEEGTWVWTSGEPVTYTNWAEGEPNNVGGEHYAAVNWHWVNGHASAGLGVWNDLGIDAGLSFGLVGLPGLMEFTAPRFSITGTHFHDRNANRAFDPDESGLAGFTIYLDSNSNGRLNSGESFAITDAQGNYAFHGLPPGDYTLAVVPQDQWQLTTSPASLAVTLVNGQSLTVDIGSRSRSRDLPSLARRPEARVTTRKSRDQLAPAVAMDAAGNSVIAWYGVDGNDFSGIYAQRYNAAGQTLGREFLVNTRTTDNWLVATAVAMDSDGDFVVVWSNEYQDGDGFDIYAQRFNSAGERVGAEFLVNTYTDNRQSSPAIAMDADGDFVIAWGSWDQDGSASGIYAQRYSAAGKRRGGEMLVNRTTDGSQFGPAIAMDADGDFVIVWRSYQHGDDDSVYAQRFSAAGKRRGTEFRVQQPPGGSYAAEPSVAMDSDGDFVIAWTSYMRYARNLDVYAQRYNAAGVRQGNEFLVNTLTEGTQHDPSLAMDPDGDFAISWKSVDANENYDIYAQRYNAAGLRQDGELPVATDADLTEFGAEVALRPSGDLLVVWTNYQDDGIYARRYVNTDPATAPAVVTGRVFNDRNCDGRSNASEPGLNGWTVFIDTNRNGLLDQDEERIDTDHTGRYAFANLSPGTYRVMVQQRAGWRRTLPATEFYEVTVAGAQLVKRRDFGQTRATLVTGAIFNDFNGNGRLDKGESGSDRMRVFIDADNDGIFDKAERSAVTDAQGNYVFVKLPPGRYILRATTPAGYHPTNAFDGLPIRLTRGQSLSNQNFAFRRR